MASVFKGDMHSPVASFGNGDAIRERPDPNDATSETYVDELDILKDLFFRSTVTRKIDWTNLFSERQHDFKFWANVTNTLGPFILKCVFNSSMPFKDTCELQRTMDLGSESGVPSVYMANYITNLKRHVSFLLLSGMINNRLPGSLRLIVRGHGYQFFESRINLLLADLTNYDVNALCFNMKALQTLFPYLQEHQPIKLSTVCYRFLTSRFWRFMWLEVAASLKTCPNSGKGELFSTFLELASVLCYGSRSSSFLKRLYKTCMKSLWDPILVVLSWSLEPKVLCRMITYIADLLLMSYQDKCHDLIDRGILKLLMQHVKEAHDSGVEYMGVYKTQTIDERNDFYHHYATIAIRMLEALSTCIKSLLENKLGDDLRTLYDLTSIGIAKMTLLPSAEGTVSASVKYNYVEEKIFTRVLPCFNPECLRIFHVDMPHLHIDGQPLDFRYCSMCGIPCYCSESCAQLHWDASHREVCGFFKALPTFSRFNQSISQDATIMINTFEEDITINPIVDKHGNVYTVF